jgi:glutamyl/glutaminyl-tRNA synthetase
MSAQSERADAYRQRAVELVNAGKLQVRPLPHSEVKEMADGSGAFTEVTVWVPAAALAPELRCWCFRRHKPVVRCFDRDPGDVGPQGVTRSEAETITGRLSAI